MATLRVACSCQPPSPLSLSPSITMLIPLSLGLFTTCTAAQLIPPFLPGRGNNGHLSCKAVPGTPNWPSGDDWAHLNQTVGGRLLRPSPPGAICHPEHASYNATACPALRAAWLTYEFHQADPVSVDWNQWTNDSCLPQEGAPCSGDGYPIFVINATTARHVQQGARFGMMRAICCSLVDFIEDDTNKPLLSHS